MYLHNFSFCFYLHIFQESLRVLYSHRSTFLIFRQRLQLLDQCPESDQLKLGQMSPPALGLGGWRVRGGFRELYQSGAGVTAVLRVNR